MAIKVREKYQTHLGYIIRDNTTHSVTFITYTGEKYHVDTDSNKAEMIGKVTEIDDTLKLEFGLLTIQKYGTYVFKCDISRVK